MYEGQSAGSAQPLVWAHAEYIKLLRSVTDGKIFDEISVVAERYAVAPGTRTFRNTVEIYQAARPIDEVPAGFTLRIVDPNRFKVVYTLDGWKTTLEANSKVVGYPGSFADVETRGVDGLSFTLYWPANADGPEHWLGHNVEVRLTEEMPQAMAAST